MQAPAWVIGIDVGGTFTDLVALDRATGRTHLLKVLSTPQDQSLGVVQALVQLGQSLERVELLVHGTTLAANSLIERKGAVCGLITTKGFRDTLELRRRDRASMFGLYTPFQPLIPRWLRLEVDERTDAEGQILRRVNEAEVVQQARRLRELGAEALSVVFLHSYANPESERRAREALGSVWPNDFISLSSEVLPEYREFERTSATVANSYLQPVMARYLNALVARLRETGVERPPLIVQGNGSMMAAATAARRPIDTVLSGPAAGVTAAQVIGRACGFDNVISCDMGGTSFDVSLIRQGRPTITHQRTPLFGLPLRVPALDIVAIGAGGGSIASIDAGGLIQVGPESAGAKPGPVCYGRGGDRPTITDANLVLGRLGQGHLTTGRDALKLDREAAAEAIQRHIGQAFGYGPEQAAAALLEVATNNMANAIRSVSINHGHDPREFVLVVFGGAGPLHATALMRHLEVPRAIIPNFPGLTSAVGCLMADLRHDFVQTLGTPLSDFDLERGRAIVRDHVNRGRALLSQAGASLTATDVLVSIDAAYEGQTHTIEVELPGGLAEGDALAQSFQQAYFAEHGTLMEGTPVRVQNLRTAVIGRRAQLEIDLLTQTAGRAASDVPDGVPQVWFGQGFQSCPLYRRERLPQGMTVDGPALIVQSDTTTVLEPGSRATVVQDGNLLLESR